MNEECNCLEDVKELIIKANNHKDFKIVGADWKNKTFYPAKRLYTLFSVQSTFTKKNGTTSMPRTEHVEVHFSYCPFCGKKYFNPDEQNH